MTNGNSLKVEVIMIKSKSICSCTHCGDTIYSGYWKAKINDFVVCGKCKLSARVNQNDWLIELAKKVMHGEQQKAL